jgi:hypothetical protein
VTAQTERPVAMPPEPPAAAQPEIRAAAQPEPPVAHPLQPETMSAGDLEANDPAWEDEPVNAEVPIATPPAPIETGVDSTVLADSDPGTPETPETPETPWTPDRRGAIEDLADVVAAVTAASDEPATENANAAASGGQYPQSVAPSPSPDQPDRVVDETLSPVADPAGIYEGSRAAEFDAPPAPWGEPASAVSAGDAEEQAASASGWSLSRFTKGLGRF